MKQLKKTILTLALLIAATTQAWATDYLYLDISSDGKSATICYGEPDGKPYLDPNNGWMQNGMDWDGISFTNRSLITTVTFDKSCQTFNGKSLKGLFFSFFGLKTLIGLDNLRTDDVEDLTGMFSDCKHLATLDLSSLNTANVTDMSSMFQDCEEMNTVDLSSFNTANVENMLNMFSDCSKLETIYVSDDWSTAKVEKSTEMFNNCKKLPGYKDSGPEYWDKRKATLTTAGGYLTYKAPGTPVATPATDATNTSLSLTQPTGNVTIRVKYYDQAEFADGLAPAAITGVQASTADPIVTPGTVKTIGTSDVKMGTVMYHASQTALSDADLLALGTDDWSSDVPKATNLSTGDAYVYYYIQGAEPASGNAADRSDANTCSDSDIKRLTVNLIAPPTYDVSLNKTGLADGEPAKWKAKSETVTTEVNLGTNDLEGVKKGETVTVTYTGDRKVIGVKAEKKAAASATPLTVEALTAGTIVVNIVDGYGDPNTLSTGMKYSVNGGTKTTITETTSIEGLKAGDKVQFYGNGTQTQVYGDNPAVRIQGSGDGFQTKVYGNIMSLLNEEGFATKTDLPNAQYVFYGLFKNNATLIDASELLLPAATLAQDCYREMFNGCSALTAAPVLPATQLAERCYYEMFNGCSALTAAPALPATTLADYCYCYMFKGCTSLTEAPVLPATTLVSYCYRQMFNNCKKLATVTCLATSGINQDNSTNRWLQYAGSEVQGTKTFNAVSTAEWPSGNDGIPNGWTRVNIDN